MKLLSIFPTKNWTGDVEKESIKKFMPYKVYENNWKAFVYKVDCIKRDRYVKLIKNRSREFASLQRRFSFFPVYCNNEFPPSCDRIARYTCNAEVNKKYLRIIFLRCARGFSFFRLLWGTVIPSSPPPSRPDRCSLRDII